MNKTINQFHAIVSAPARQRGVITTFTGILILVMLGLMMFFAMRVGGYEQRVSANDARQKLAFHTAESGIQQAKEFFLINSVLIADYTEDFLPNGTDGWLAETVEKRWQKCSDASLGVQWFKIKVAAGTLQADFLTSCVSSI